MPECAYVRYGRDIKEFGLRYFFVETHGINLSFPVPRYGVYAPVYCRSGVAAFGRDPESSRQVWDSHAGYPGNPYYREFYRDIGFDLPLDYLAPCLPGGNIRCDTGLKYYRITGPGEHKEPYQPDIAAQIVAGDAHDFARKRDEQVKYLSEQMDRRPIIVAPYDAELFGHWWYEGPQWLEHFAGYRLRKLRNRCLPYSLPGPLCRQPGCRLAASVGEKADITGMAESSNDWICRHLQAETTMVDLADYIPMRGILRRSLNQAAETAGPEQ